MDIQKKYDRTTEDLGNIVELEHFNLVPADQNHSNSSGYRGADICAPESLGIAYIKFDVPEGTARGIVRFYDEIFGATATIGEWDGETAARINAGNRQELIFRETKEPMSYSDQHPIKIYIRDFSRPYSKLIERDLISQENNQHQYLFEHIIDLDTEDILFTIDHEVRSMNHPSYSRN